MSNSNKKRKILLLFCGGTISMHKGDEGALKATFTHEQFFELEPRIHDIAEISVRFVINEDSTNTGRQLWEELAAIIEKEYDHYDGFLITTGTNTMAYMSSALSFSIQNLGKPVAITGAQIPAEIISSDARNNLVNAVRVATMDLGGVFVVFGSKVIKGCRAKKKSESDLDAFGTFNQSDLGEISLGIRIMDDDCCRHNDRPVFRNGFEDNIVCFTNVPGLKNNHVEALIDNGVKGLVFRGFGSGDVPEVLLPALKKAYEKEIPVIITTQCPGGATVMGVNEPGLLALKAGVVQAFDMSMESMTTKLMWMLHQKVKFANFKSVFQKNLVGEIDNKKTRFFVSEELKSLKDYQD